MIALSTTAPVRPAHPVNANAHPATRRDEAVAASAVHGQEREQVVGSLHLENHPATECIAMSAFAGMGDTTRENATQFAEIR